ncbi:hypothetical protein [Erysipelothrix anatis]|uniref:hypothetical protein n=1 Tax=Erysipelothrix anatis TaxID=2683713 RepID=UPI00135B7830|nr:hypothetical protein [Erysipelothrix anatis]
MIKNKSGRKKEYIYKKDISDFLLCGTSKAARIFREVKEYELSLMEIEMFENRVPQDLFHEWRTKRRKRGN